MRNIGLTRAKKIIAHSARLTDFIYYQISEK